MRVTLKEMHFENYKCFHNKDISFGADRTTITGKNRAGKTTVMDGYFDIMTGKLSTGMDAASDEIRTHDADGNLVQKVDVVREATLDVDGRETVIRKIDEQNWVRPRGTTQEVFKGNKTRYEVDGIPMATKRQFDEWMAGNITSAENMLLCCNPQYFLSKLNKSSTDARTILEGISGFSVNDYEQFADAKRLLGGHSAEDVLKKLRKQLAEQKDRLEKKNTEIAYETNRVSSSEDQDLATMKEAAESVVNDIQKELTLIEGSVGQYDETKAGIALLKEKRQKFIENSWENYLTERANKKQFVMELKQRLSNTDSIIKSKQFSVRSYSQNAGINRENIKAIGEKWKEISAKTYDGETTCPFCGQELPSERIEEAKSKFESQKAMQLRDLESEGNRLKSAIQDANKMVTALEEEIRTLAADGTSLEEKIKEVEADIAAMKEPDLPEVVKEMDIAIAEAEKTVSELEKFPAKKRELTESLMEAKKSLMIVETQIEAEKREAEDKKLRIERLNMELRDISQGAADIERDIQTLMDYSIQKNAIIAEKVNKHFHHFQFKFLEFTQEGNPVEVCKLMVDGTSYNGLLNGGDKRLTDIDLCRGFQDMLGLNLPIWMDEAGTVDSWRIPKTEQQLILIKYSEGELNIG